ncbi:MAG TPA: ABC transporter ATP-binding protein [Gemmataceae bacterium]|nr:ABC transporter ATP-binding protein [Gemmataceae bacterium]
MPGEDRVTPAVHVAVETPIRETPRVAQVRGIFDLKPEKASRLEWTVCLPLHEQDWHIGLVVGPSGCGKSTIARALWPHETAEAASLTWPRDESILDGFPPGLSVRDVTALLSAVGFSSPPAWLRSFHVLSTGQQFRATLARLLAGPAPLVVLDEYSSVVDRTVAQVGSAALAKTVRARGQRFVAVTCHEDVQDWLQPDWVYRPAEDLFQWRCLQRRPAVALAVVRCAASAWPLFAPHHYLADGLNRSAVCFLATWREQPVAFSAWLPFFGGGPRARREHRTVTLPDFQGIGIGNALSDFCASLWKGLGYRATSTTTHPAMIRARLKSGHWRLTRRPSFAAGHEGKVRHATTRLTAGFEYVGPPLPRRTAEDLVGT